VIPARELLADMYLQTGDAAKALQAYEEDLRKHNNRFNGLYGAGLAAEKSGDAAKAKTYYGQLLAIANTSSIQRNELRAAKQFLQKH
jgi:tetratricopeptide (TPR) repeat protein